MFGKENKVRNLSRCFSLIFSKLDGQKESGCCFDYILFEQKKKKNDRSNPAIKYELL